MIKRVGGNLFSVFRRNRYRVIYFRWPIKEQVYFKNIMYTHFVAYEFNGAGKKNRKSVYAATDSINGLAGAKA